MKKPDMIFFDYGETLVHERSQNELRGARRVLSLAAKNPDGICAEEYCEAFFELHQKSTVLGYEQGFEVPIVTFLRVLNAKFGLEFTIGEEALAEEFWNAVFEHEPIPRAPETIDALNARDLPYAVVSNIAMSGKNLSKLLKSVIPNFRPAFVLTSSDYFFRKPNKILTDVALKKSGVSSDRIWFVGDKPHRDVDAALAAGITPVLYDPKGRYPDAKVVKIASLAELMPLLDGAGER